jgi:hypothetical protein
MERTAWTPIAALAAAALMISSSVALALWPGRAATVVATLLLTAIPIVTELLRRRVAGRRPRPAWQAALLAASVGFACLLTASDFAAFAAMAPIFGAAAAATAFEPATRARACR